MSENFDNPSRPAPASASLPPAARNQTEGPLKKLLLKRGSHSSRAITAALLSVLFLAAFVYLLIELVLEMARREPLLMAPTQMLANLPYLYETILHPWLAVGGIFAALFGLFLIYKALAPGAFGRHQIESARAAYIVDDSVIAAGISQAIRQAANLPPGQVTTSVDARNVLVRVTPHFGRKLDRDLLEQTLRQQLSDYNLRPQVRGKLEIMEAGE